MTPRVALAPYPSSAATPRVDEGPSGAEGDTAILEQTRRNRIARFNFEPSAPAFAGTTVSARQTTDGVSSPSKPPPSPVAVKPRGDAAQQPPTGGRRRRTFSAPSLVAPDSPPGPRTPPPAPGPRGEWVTFRIPDSGAVVYICLEADVTPGDVEAWSAGERPWPPMHTLEISSVLRRVRRLSNLTSPPADGCSALALFACGETHPTKPAQQT